MKKKQGIRVAVAAAFLAACAASGFALAVDEVEPNAPVSLAQRLTVGSGGSVTVQGAVGELRADGTRDTVDFFSFFARKDDVLDVDIDGGMKPSGTPRSVDTSLFILGPAPTYERKIWNLSATQLDAGSTSTMDARIPVYKIPGDGVYTVAVTGSPREVRNGGTIFLMSGSTQFQGGTYTLTISGVTPEVQIIHIEIKPGSGEATPINPKSKGNIPVALLSSVDFNALLVEPESLTFGRTGNEKSWIRCAKEGTDVNGDGLLDLVCHFENQLAEFDADTVAGVVKGKIKSVGAASLSASGGGGAFEGHADLKVRSK
jgi:hypothetical protein